jgi:hypothetical protein
MRNFSAILARDNFSLFHQSIKNNAKGKVNAWILQSEDMVAAIIIIAKIASFLNPDTFICLRYNRMVSK